MSITPEQYAKLTKVQELLYSGFLCDCPSGEIKNGLIPWRGPIHSETCPGFLKMIHLLDSKDFKTDVNNLIDSHQRTER